MCVLLCYLLFVFFSNSKYNGIALWIEWILDDNDKNVISTGPTVPPTINQFIQWDMHTRQGVHFLESKNKDGICSKIDFDVKNGLIKFCFS